MKRKEELGEKIRNATPEQRQNVAEHAGESLMTVEGYGNAPKTIPDEKLDLLEASSVAVGLGSLGSGVARESLDVLL